MNRRNFISAFAGAVASVSIGLKMSHGMSDGVILGSMKYPENSNILVTAADLSEASLEELCINVLKQTAGRGIAINPTKILSPTYR